MMRLQPRHMQARNSAIATAAGLTPQEVAALFSDHNPPAGGPPHTGSTTPGSAHPNLKQLAAVLQRVQDGATGGTSSLQFGLLHGCCKTVR